MVGRVTRESHALSLRRSVFKLNDPRKIARSLKRSAERSRARKARSRFAHQAYAASCR
jgi:hypothetical protein